MYFSNCNLHIQSHERNADWLTDWVQPGIECVAHLWENDIKAIKNCHEILNWFKSSWTDVSIQIFKMQPRNADLYFEHKTEHWEAERQSRAEWYRKEVKHFHIVLYQKAIYFVGQLIWITDQYLIFYTVFARAFSSALCAQTHTAKRTYVLMYARIQIYYLVVFWFGTFKENSIETNA